MNARERICNHNRWLSDSSFDIENVSKGERKDDRKLHANMSVCVCVYLFVFLSHFCIRFHSGWYYARFIFISLSLYTFVRIYFNQSDVQDKCAVIINDCFACKHVIQITARFIDNVVTALPVKRTNCIAPFNIIRHLLMLLFFLKSFF